MKTERKELEYWKQQHDLAKEAGSPESFFTSRKMKEARSFLKGVEKYEAKYNEPKAQTIEEKIEELGGWKEKGLRQKFDKALIERDFASVKEYMPRVPKYYIEKFKEEILEIRKWNERMEKEEAKELRKAEKRWKKEEARDWKHFNKI